MLRLICYGTVALVPTLQAPSTEHQPEAAVTAVSKAERARHGRHGPVPAVLLAGRLPHPPDKGLLHHGESRADDKKEHFSKYAAFRLTRMPRNASSIK